MSHIHVDTTTSQVLVLFATCLFVRLYHTCSHISTAKWESGRPTKIQKTTRPDSRWLEAWTHLPKKQREQEKKKVGTRKCQTPSTSPKFDESTDLLKVIAAARSKLEKDSVPASPCVMMEDRQSRAAVLLFYRG